MKENFSYEDHTDELKKSISVGTACVGIVTSRIWEANKDIVKYAVKDAIHTRLRCIKISELLKKE